MSRTPLILLGILVLFIGFFVAWAIYRPRPSKPEVPAMAVRQKDGSLELERKGTQAPGVPGGIKPAQIIPKGGKVERIVQLTVQPLNLPISPGRIGGIQPPITPGDRVSGLNGTPKSKPLEVDLTLVRMPDNSRRVLASSPDGQVVGGIDVPIGEPKLPRIQRWTAEALAGYDSHAARNVFGGEVSYQKGPIAVSGGIIGGTAFVGAGIRF